MHLDASGLPISTASGKAAAAYDFLVILPYPAGRYTSPVLPPFWGCRSGVQGLALGSLVDCEFRNEEATLRSYLVTLARINV